MMKRDLWISREFTIPYYVPRSTIEFFANKTKMTGLYHIDTKGFKIPNLANLADAS